MRLEIYIYICVNLLKDINLTNSNLSGNFVIRYLYYLENIVDEFFCCCYTYGKIPIHYRYFYSM